MSSEYYNNSSLPKASKSLQDSNNDSEYHSRLAFIIADYPHIKIAIYEVELIQA